MGVGISQSVLLSVVVSDFHTSVDPDSESQLLDNGRWDQSVLLSVVVSNFHTSVDPDSESQRLDNGSWDQSVLLSVVVSDSRTSVDPDSGYSVYMSRVRTGVVAGCCELFSRKY